MIETSQVSETWNNENNTKIILLIGIMEPFFLPIFRLVFIRGKFSIRLKSRFIRQKKIQFYFYRMNDFQGKKESKTKYEYLVPMAGCRRREGWEFRGMKKIKLFPGIRFFIFLFGITFKFTSLKIRVSSNEC